MDEFQISVLTELRAINRLLQLQAPAVDPADEYALSRLLPEVYKATGGGIWTARELMQLADNHEALSLLLAHTIGTSAGASKRLGNLMRRSVGCSVNDFVVSRHARDASGGLAQWRVRWVPNPSVSPENV